MADDVNGQQYINMYLISHISIYMIFFSGETDGVDGRERGSVWRLLPVRVRLLEQGERDVGGPHQLRHLHQTAGHYTAAAQRCLTYQNSIAYFLNPSKCLYITITSIRHQLEVALNISTLWISSKFRSTCKQVRLNKYQYELTSSWPFPIMLWQWVHENLSKSNDLNLMEQSNTTFWNLTDIAAVDNVRFLTNI